MTRTTTNRRIEKSTNHLNKQAAYTEILKDVEGVSTFITTPSNSGNDIKAIIGSFSYPNILSFEKDFVLYNEGEERFGHHIDDFLNQDVFAVRSINAINEFVGNQDYCLMLDCFSDPVDGNLRRAGMLTNTLFPKYLVTTFGKMNSKPWYRKKLYEKIEMLEDDVFQTLLSDKMDIGDNYTNISSEYYMSANNTRMFCVSLFERDY